MSVSLHKWTLACEGLPCPGDCDFCNREPDENTFTAFTFPDVYIDYENEIENENYDNEIKAFSVPKDWATAWARTTCGITLDEFRNEYTYDDTAQMLDDAYDQGVLIEEKTLEGGTI